MSAEPKDINKLVTENLDIWTTAIKAKSRTGRGSNKTNELYGIKKLRELILDLAVRGLLVPQDPNDEPASELLKKIAIEKDQLIKNGKIKKQKPLPEITEEEKPFELPEGWEWRRLGSIGLTQTGGTPKKSNSHHYGEFIPFIKPGDISEGKINSYFNDGLSQEGAEQLGRIAPSDSVLMVCIGTIGKSARVDRSVSFNQQINSVTSYVKIGCYLEKILQASFFQKTAWDNSSSTTLSILNKGKWDLIPIPIAPEKTQKRIVAKVDELMALCDQLEQLTDSSIKAHKLLVENLLNALTQAKDHKNFQQAWQRIAKNFDTLFTTEHSIDQLKQTILQLAVMGKLVPQDPNDEPASELLKKIAAEKEKLIKAGKIKKQKPLPEITDEEKPFELPEGWEFYRLETTLNKITDGTHHSPKNGSSGDFYYISAKNIKNEGVKTSNATFVTKELHDEIYSRCNPERGDILYIKDGATTGVVTLNNLDEPFSMLSSVALLKPSKKLNNQFLLLALRSPFFYSEMRSGMSGVAITRVTLKKLNFAFIPIPPHQEQNRIVTKVNELLTLCDQIKSQITSSKKVQSKIADTLTHS